MKKAVAVLLVAMFLIALAVPAYADAENKLKSGFKQFVTSPKTFYDTVIAEKNAAEFKPFGIIGGICKGTVYTLKEAGLGLLNTATFFIDNK